MRCTHEDQGRQCWRSDPHDDHSHHLFPNRGDLVALVYPLEAERVDTADAVVDEVILPALAAYGDLSEQQRVAEAVTLGSQSWMAANARQVAAIGRLMAERGDLRQHLADVRTALERIEATATDLERRYNALTAEGDTVTPG